VGLRARSGLYRTNRVVFDTAPPGGRQSGEALPSSKRLAGRFVPRRPTSRRLIPLYGKTSSLLVVA
jgi:hypothetical protein